MHSVAGTAFCMGGTVTIGALHLPEGVAWQAWRFVGAAACHASQKVTVPEFPVTSVASNACHVRLNPILESTNPTPERQPSGLLGWVRDKAIKHW
jgi:hypothetical protein